MAELTLAIPVRNGARFLEATLQSLCTQGNAVRWWLQDGGSTDGTLELARRLQRPNDIVRSEPDQGQADALNRAFAEMGGDIIGYLNADDCLAPGAAENVSEFFATHPEVDLIYGATEWIDEAGAVIGRHAGCIDSIEEVLDIYHVWWSGRQWVQPEVFFRRQLWERAGPFDTRYHLAFDFDLWVRCFLAGARVARRPQTLAQFRLHAEQKSRAAALAAREIRDSVARHLPAAAVAVAFARRLRAHLDYDEYHLGEGAYAQSKPAFSRYLLSHPRAFRLRAVRQRLWQSLRLRA